MEEKKIEEKTFTLKFTESELKQKLADLEQDEELMLYTKVNSGARKYSELMAIVFELEKQEKK